MDSLDKVRARQQAQRQTVTAKSGNMPQKKAESDNVRKSKKKKNRRAKNIFGIAVKVFVLLLLAAIIFSGIWIAKNIDFTFGDDLSSMNLNLSSTVYYTDEDGNQKKYEQFVASENRIWVSIDKIPKNLQNAFVAIEDQRFYKHHGVDLKRSVGAAANYILKGDSSYGGSTITQQLVKNITNDKEHTKARKIREMLRAVVLESKISKEQILEMYMNTIYLSQGANGVEAAANVYFSKDVSELTLSECACIAGITQYPSKYDPLTNPDNNASKRKLVLGKMLELGYITKSEYNEAIDDKLEFKQGKEKEQTVQSYFMDALFEELLEDLINKGYSEQFATNMLYNGGLKIYATVDPSVQKTMEKVYTSESSFPKFSGDTQPESAMVVSDPKTGQVRGIVGGRGKKSGNRVLNRATQTLRQPGSSIKPIAVYGPAVDLGLITEGTIVEDSQLEINGWEPKNSDRKYHGYVSVKSAVAHSYNIPAVRVLEKLTVDKSYKYLKNKLHMDTIISSETKNGKVYSDKNLSSLALGGLTNGVTVMDMNAAYASFANGGEYIEPSLYTKVYDADGRLLLQKEPETNEAFSNETAYLMNLLLQEVVKSGTGYGAQISNMDTCGKTGTTDDSKDRWFIGYTPYYVGSVWFGYDVQKTISAYGNPALNVWKSVMTEIHKDLDAKHFKQPSGVEKMTVCTNTGRKPTSSCSRTTVYANKAYASQMCSGKHDHIGTKTKYQYKAPSNTTTKTDNNSSQNTTGQSTGTSQNNSSSNDLTHDNETESSSSTTQTNRDNASSTSDNNR